MENPLSHRTHIVLTQNPTPPSHPLSKEGVYFVPSMESALKKAQSQIDILYKGPKKKPYKKSHKEPQEEPHKKEQEGFYQKAPKEDVFIIGGGQIFTQSLHVIEYAHLTLIHQTFEGDTFYPQIPQKNKSYNRFHLKGFTLIEHKDRPGPPPFSFLTYRKNPS